VIPKPIIDVAEAARATVRAFQELREARRLEASERALSDRRKALNKALEQLEKVVVELEKKLAAAKAKKTGKPFDWAGLFNVTGKILDLASKAKKGEFTRDDVKIAGDIIDAEIIGEPETRPR
jgi:uncharacterized protein YlxW (UPF0749 family)